MPRWLEAGESPADGQKGLRLGAPNRGTSVRCVSNWLEGETEDPDASFDILLAIVASLGCETGVVSGALIEMKMDEFGINNS